MCLTEQLSQNSEVPRTTDAGSMSTAKKVVGNVKSVHVQSAPVPPLNRVQVVTSVKPEPRFGPTTIIIPPWSNLVASMEPEDFDTPPFTAQQKLIYVPADILNIRVGALLDSWCIDNFISRTTAYQLGLTMYQFDNGHRNANGQCG